MERVVAGADMGRVTGLTEDGQKFRNSLETESLFDYEVCDSLCKIALFAKISYLNPFDFLRKFFILPSSMDVL